MLFLWVGDKGSTGHKDTSLKTIDNEGFVCTMELERGEKNLLALNMWNFSGSRWSCPLESRAHSSSQQMWQEGRLGGKTLERNPGLPFRACMPGWSHRQEIYNSTSTLCRPMPASHAAADRNLQVSTVCVFVHLCVWGKERGVSMFHSQVCKIKLLLLDGSLQTEGHNIKS